MRNTHHQASTTSNREDRDRYLRHESLKLNQQRLYPSLTRLKNTDSYKSGERKWWYGKVQTPSAPPESSTSCSSSDSSENSRAGNKHTAVKAYSDPNEKKSKRKTRATRDTSANADIESLATSTHEYSDRNTSGGAKDGVTRKQLAHIQAVIDLADKGIPFRRDLERLIYDNERLKLSKENLENFSKEMFKHLNRESQHRKNLEKRIETACNIMDDFQVKYRSKYYKQQIESHYRSKSCDYLTSSSNSSASADSKTSSIACAAKGPNLKVSGKAYKNQAAFGKEMRVKKYDKAEKDYSDSRKGGAGVLDRERVQRETQSWYKTENIDRHGAKQYETGLRRDGKKYYGKQENAGAYERHETVKNNEKMCALEKLTKIKETRVRPDSGLGTMPKHDKRERNDAETKLHGRKSRVTAFKHELNSEKMSNVEKLREALRRDGKLNEREGEAKMNRNKIECTSNETKHFEKQSNRNVNAIKTHSWALPLPPPVNLNDDEVSEYRKRASEQYSSIQRNAPCLKDIIENDSFRSANSSLDVCINGRTSENRKGEKCATSAHNNGSKSPNMLESPKVGWTVRDYKLQDSAESQDLPVNKYASKVYSKDLEKYYSRINIIQTLNMRESQINRIAGICCETIDSNHVSNRQSTKHQHKTNLTNVKVPTSNDSRTDSNNTSPGKSSLRNVSFAGPSTPSFTPPLIAVCNNSQRNGSLPPSVDSQEYFRHNEYEVASRKTYPLRPTAPLESLGSSLSNNGATQVKKLLHPEGYGNTVVNGRSKTELFDHIVRTDEILQYVPRRPSKMFRKNLRVIEHYPQQLDQRCFELPNVNLSKRKQRVIKNRALRADDLRKGLLYKFNIIGWVQQEENWQVKQKTIEGDVIPSGAGGYYVRFNNITDGLVDFLRGATL